MSSEAEKHSKRMLDVLFSLSVLTGLGPVILLFMFLVWRQDHNSPLYLAPRVGKDGKMFRMVKLRSMRPDADKSGVNSTSLDDDRITPLGHVIRKYKLDEFTQFWNVLVGEMSVVGPRPQVKDEVDTYSEEEQGLLAVKPGVTDFSSIVFSDEGEILKFSKDPDRDYDRLIRPWKSKFGLLYIEKRSMLIDILLISLTGFSLVSRKTALSFLSSLLARLDADDDLIEVARRDVDLSFHGQSLNEAPNHQAYER